jgi:hypothetical protein
MSRTRRIVAVGMVTTASVIGLAGVAHASDHADRDREPQHHGHHYYQDHDPGFLANLAHIGDDGH